MPRSRFSVLFGLTLICCWLVSLEKPFLLPGYAQFTSDPIVEIQYRYYAISGKTASELRSQMTANGPHDPNEDQSYDARVDWTVTWLFQTQLEARQCRLQAAQTRVVVTYILPKWQIPPTAERSLVADWNHYLAALHQHEDGHKQHGIDAGRDILQALHQLPAAASCLELRQSVHSTARRLIQRYANKDIEYDRATRHGYTQGAVFPAVTTVSSEP